MCRILGYLGPAISIDHLVLEPAHSMLVQSYKPKELNNAVLNGDGFGLGWQAISPPPSSKKTASAPEEAFVYRNILPMWNDRSLPDLCRYIRAENFVVNLRSATDKMPVDLSNCQPFKWVNGRHSLLFVHNGFIENFFDTLQRPIRQKLCDRAYRSLQGLTDSEHIFALFIHHLETQPNIDLAEALRQTIRLLADMANAAHVRIAANIILSVKHTDHQSTNHRLISLRYDNQQTAPSLYWLKEPASFPNSILVSSEPLFQADWQSHPQSKLISIDNALNMKTCGSIA
ncbi:MAG: ergothioneine biosynthesis protein EgtC [Cyanobacteria bacterium J06554_3]